MNDDQQQQNNNSKRLIHSFPAPANNWTPWYYTGAKQTSIFGVRPWASGVSKQHYVGPHHQGHSELSSYYGLDMTTSTRILYIQLETSCHD